MKTTNWTRTNILQKGDTITFRPRYFDHDITATVVSITRFAHCVGASSFSVYSQETSCVYSMDLIGGNYKVTARAETEAQETKNLEAARDHYRKHLSQYPAWRESLAAGRSVGF